MRWFESPILFDPFPVARSAARPPCAARENLCPIELQIVEERVIVSPNR